MNYQYFIVLRINIIDNVNSVPVIFSQDPLMIQIICISFYVKLILNHG